MKKLAMIATVAMSMSSAAQSAITYNVSQDGADVLVTLPGRASFRPFQYFD